MIRMTRLTDYGIMLLVTFAREPVRRMHSAREVAHSTHLPRPTVSKLLKLLARHGILQTHRGVRGGFSLSRPPKEITVSDIIGALEGPLGMTECSAHPGNCTIESFCGVRANWRRINLVVVDALRGITLADMARPLALLPATGTKAKRVV